MSLKEQFDRGCPYLMLDEAADKAVNLNWRPLVGVPLRVAG
jgi:hypothetical protein